MLSTPTLIVSVRDDAEEFRTRYTHLRPPYLPSRCCAGFRQVPLVCGARHESHAAWGERQADELRRLRILRRGARRSVRLGSPKFPIRLTRLGVHAAPRRAPDL